MIHFEPDTYEAVHAGDRIRLLPKEFLLLRFLYEHAGRSFTRSQLLDAVWPLEAPVDRTVDDHIYRLRRRLAGWSHLLRVETIRGQGYKLTRLAPETRDNPLLLDAQFAADINRMLSKYHGLGMGAAMRLLTANRDVLGLPGDPFYDAYIRFVQGDFDGLLAADNLDPWQKAVYAAFLHAVVQFEARASLAYIERLIARSSELTREWRCDLQLQAVPLYAASGLLAEAREQLEAVRPDIAELDSPSFTAVYLLKEAYVEMLGERQDLAAAKLRECETLLDRHPIRRERGAYQVIQALFLYRQGELRTARRALDEGLETLRETQFVPHLLGSLHLALADLGAGGCDETYRLKLQREWDRLAAEYRFDELAARAKRLLERLL